MAKPRTDKDPGLDKTPERVSVEIKDVKGQREAVPRGEPTSTNRRPDTALSRLGFKVGARPWVRQGGLDRPKGKAPASGDVRPFTRKELKLLRAQAAKSIKAQKGKKNTGKWLAKLVSQAARNIR